MLVCRRHVVDSCGRLATSKLNIIPLSWCSAMWQCAIQRPGFVTSSRMSTVSPVRTSTVSFQTRFGSASSSRLEDEEAARAVDVEGVVHWVVGVHLVDQADLHLVADPELPVDPVVLVAGRRSMSFQACSPVW